MQLVVDIGGLDPLLTKRLGLATAEDTNKTLPTGLVAHRVKILGERRRHIVEPHDQLGNVRIHHLGMSMYVIQRRILDVDGNVVTALHLATRGINPPGEFGNLCLCGSDLFLRLAQLGIEIGHHVSSS